MAFRLAASGDELTAHRKAFHTRCRGGFYYSQRGGMKNITPPALTLSDHFKLSEFKAKKNLRQGGLFV
jgi:hypothetical protein